MNVAILTPLLGNLTPWCATGLRECEDAGMRVITVRGHHMGRARNYLAQKAMDDKVDTVVWVDSDIAFELQDIEKLLSKPEPIVGVAYPDRAKIGMTIVPLPGTEVVFSLSSTMTEVLAIGAGFLKVDNSVHFDIVNKAQLPLCNSNAGRIYPLYMPTIVTDHLGGKWIVGEDLGFCDLARRCGYKIWCAPDIAIGHGVNQPVTWADMGPILGGTTREFKVKAACGS